MTSIRRFSGLGLLFALAAGLPAIGQIGRPGGRSGTSLPPAVPGGGRQSRTQKSRSVEGPVPTFTGTIRGVDSKILTVEEAGANLLQFNCSKKTKYYDGSKKIKSATLKPGDRVAVDARRALDGSLDAVTVRLAPHDIHAPAK